MRIVCTRARRLLRRTTVCQDLHLAQSQGPFGTARPSARLAASDSDSTDSAYLRRLALTGARCDVTILLPRACSTARSSPSHYPTLHPPPSALTQASTRVPVPARLAQRVGPSDSACRPSASDCRTPILAQASRPRPRPSALRLWTSAAPFIRSIGALDRSASVRVLECNQPRATPSPLPFSRSAHLFATALSLRMRHA